MGSVRLVNCNSRLIDCRNTSRLVIHFIRLMTSMTSRPSPSKNERIVSGWGGGTCRKLLYVDPPLH